MSNARFDTTELVRVIGQRMAIMIEMSNMSQQRAAEKLGYANSTKLSKVCSGNYGNSVPLWLIPKFSVLFNCSTDYLYGLHDDFENIQSLASQAAVRNFLIEQNEKSNARVLNNLRLMEKEIQLIVRHLDEFNDEVQRLNKGWHRCYQLSDGEIESMPGGNLVYGPIQNLLSISARSNRALAKFLAKAETFKADPSQTSVFEVA